MSALIETLSSYVPALIMRRLATDLSPITEPIAEHFPAAVLFTDITGFTALTERLAQRGPVGAEELSRVLNAYFGQLIDLVVAHGGDIVKFAGDALMTLWPATDTDLATVTRWATQCGFAVQKALHNYAAMEGVQLALRVGVAAGDILAMHIGGVFGRWEYVVAGAPLIDVAMAEHHAEPGQVIVSPGAWQLVQDHCVGQALPTGDVHLGSIHTPSPPRPLEKPLLSDNAETQLRAYIPGAIRARVVAGQTGWLAELRRITVLFINLPDLNYDTPLDHAQTVMRSLQESLYRYEGSINKLSVDDKGITLVAALGLPPLAHEDDASRGVQAALAMQAKLGELGLHSATGIVSGQAFCGAIGSERRREYTMMGDVVNLSARLMQAAPNDILCDTTTYQAAQSDLMFDMLPPITVKGKAEPIAIYRPRGLKKLSARPRSQDQMVGRTAERALLAEQLQAVLRGGLGGLVIIEGEAGIGKSRLVEDLQRHAEALHVTVFSGAAEAIEKATPYFAWRRVISQLLDLEVLTDPAARRQHILNLLEDEPEVLRLAPLLSTLLSLDLPDNDITVQMTGQVRADNTTDLLRRLLQASVSRSPKGLIIENAHWMDSASWALTLLVSQRVHPLLCILTTRPLSAPLPVEYTQMLNAPGTQRLRLEALPPEDTLALVCQRLGVVALPEPVAALIKEKAQGNPFFSEELAYALRDKGLIHIADGECRIAPEAGELRFVNLPDTVQGVITSRIDRLNPAQQLALKVASVIGRGFVYSILHDIYPIEADKHYLEEYLDTLHQLDLTPLDAPDPDPAYVFKNIITQEVAYNLMLFSQRRGLHRAVAEWYERTQTEDLSQFYPLLAHHLTIAIDLQNAELALVTKAVDCLEKAGEQALRNYMNQEAIGFFSQALALDDLQLRVPSQDATSPWPASPPASTTPKEPSSLRRARWERQLGEAYLNLGNLSEGREHLQQAVAILGKPVPGTRGGLLASMLRQVLLQVTHCLSQAVAKRWRTWFANGALPSDASAHRSPAAGEHSLEAARAYWGLAQIYFYANELMPNIYANLRSLNLAEVAGISPELARSYANMCIAAGLVPLHAVAEAYSRRARDTAESLEQYSHHRAWVMLITAVYNAGVGQWTRAQDALRQAVEISEHLGDRRRWEQSFNTLATVTYLQGEFTHSAKLFGELYASAQRRGDVQYQAYGLLGQARCRLPLAQVEKAAADLDALEALLARKLGRVEEILAHGVKALVCLRQGDQALAQQAAEKAAHLIEQSRPVSYTLLHAYAGVAEVYLALWEAELRLDASARMWSSAPDSPSATPDQPSAIHRLQAEAQRACRTLQGFARVFPIGQPRAWLWEGMYAWLSGKPARAHKAWQKSLASAERLNMPYEQGLAQYEMGRHTTGADRQRYLTRASEIFSRLGATYDLGRAQAAAEHSDEIVSPQPAGSVGLPD